MGTCACEWCGSAATETRRGVSLCSTCGVYAQEYERGLVTRILMDEGPICHHPLASRMVGEVDQPAELATAARNRDWRALQRLAA